MMKYLMVFLLVMAIQYILREALSIVKSFRKSEEFKQSWYKTLLAFVSVAYTITVIILGI
jgi:hypothetical protein